MKTIRANELDLDEWLEVNLGKHPADDTYGTIIRGAIPVDVLKPDGSPLLYYRPNALPLDVCESARPFLRYAGANFSEHRRLSSAIAGYYHDKDGCRTTAITRADLDGFFSALPFIRAVDRVFANVAPERHANQRAVAEKTKRYVIPRTTFTTVTVNLWDPTHDARTRLHVDKGDLREGMGVLSILTQGSFSGGYLVFPKYRVAVDLKTTDVLIADVHEIHGNAPIRGDDDGWERIACVFYYQTKMLECGA